MSFDTIMGRCMACGGRSLFVSSGGFITCARSDCPDPGAVADWLDRPDYHTIRLSEDGWSLQHPVTCFPDLTTCEVHAAASREFERAKPDPMFHGLYRCKIDGGWLAMDAIKEPA